MALKTLEKLIFAINMNQLIRLEKLGMRNCNKYSILILAFTILGFVVITLYIGIPLQPLTALAYTKELSIKKTH